MILEAVYLLTVGWDWSLSVRVNEATSLKITSMAIFMKIESAVRYH